MGIEINGAYHNYNYPSSTSSAVGYYQIDYNDESKKSGTESINAYYTQGSYTDSQYTGDTTSTAAYVGITYTDDEKSGSAKTWKDGENTSRADAEYGKSADAGCDADGCLGEWTHVGEDRTTAVAIDDGGMSIVVLEEYSAFTKAAPVYEFSYDDVSRGGEGALSTWTQATQLWSQDYPVYGR